MKLKLNLLTVTAIVLALLGASFILGRVSTHRQVESLSNAVSEAQNQLKTQASSYQMVINSKNVTVTTQKSVIMRQKDAIESGLIERDELKALNIKRLRENLRLKGQIAILKDSLDKPPDVIIIHDSTGTDKPCMELPVSFRDKDDWAEIHTWVNQDGTWGYDFSTDLDIDIKIGLVKTGFLKSEPKVLVLKENPYVNFINVQSITFEETPFYTKSWFTWTTHGAAFALGFFLGGK